MYEIYKFTRQVAVFGAKFQSPKAENEITFRNSSPSVLRLITTLGYTRRKN